MNLGSPIELLLLAVFIGAGAYLGEQHLGGAAGAAVGGLLGALVRVVLGISIHLLDRWPACSCGNDREDRFEFVEHATARFAWKCRECGKLYQRGQGFRGTWKPVQKE
jgi:hypothetical protein